MPVFDNTDGKKKPVAAHAVADFFKARKQTAVAKEAQTEQIEAPADAANDEPKPRKKAKSKASEKQKDTDK